MCSPLSRASLNAPDLLKQLCLGFGPLARPGCGGLGVGTCLSVPLPAPCQPSLSHGTAGCHQHPGFVSLPFPASGYCFSSLFATLPCASQPSSPISAVLLAALTPCSSLSAPVAQLRPACEQIYNLFHAADPCASRLEPLLAKAFHAVPPLSVPRYQKYPLGDGTSSLLGERPHCPAGPGFSRGVPKWAPGGLTRCCPQRRPCRCTLPSSCPRWTWLLPRLPPAASGASGGAASLESPPRPPAPAKLSRVSVTPCPPRPSTVDVRRSCVGLEMGTGEQGVGSGPGMDSCELSWQSWSAGGARSASTTRCTAPTR